jgi:hypothetical protein
MSKVAHHVARANSTGFPTQQTKHPLFIGPDGAIRVPTTGRGGWRRATPIDFALSLGPIFRLVGYRSEEG